MLVGVATKKTPAFDDKVELGPAWEFWSDATANVNVIPYIAKLL